LAQYIRTMTVRRPRPRTTCQGRSQNAADLFCLGDLLPGAPARDLMSSATGRQPPRRLEVVHQGLARSERMEAARIRRYRRVQAAQAGAARAASIRAARLRRTFATVGWLSP